jgi:hypothetical protein
MGRCLSGSAVAAGRSIGCYRTSADHCVSAPSPGARWQTPSGMVQTAAAYFAASTQQSDWCPGSVRRKAGKRRGCRQAVVRGFPDIPPTEPDFQWLCRTRSTSPGPGPHCTLACPILLFGLSWRGFSPSRFKRNEAGEGQPTTKKVKIGRGARIRLRCAASGDADLARRRAFPYSTLPIFLTAAIRRALSSATNFENSGASR